MTHTLNALFIYIYIYNNIINDHTHIHNVIDDEVFIILLPCSAETSGEKLGLTEQIKNHQIVMLTITVC